MGRSFADWLAQQDQAVVKADLNPSSAELLDWVTSGQIDAMRK
jgi:hypothetical protein